MDRLVASELLRESVERHEIHLSVLVADTGIWSNPAVHQRLLAQTGEAAMTPGVRRARAGEQSGDVIDGVRLDNNTYANVAIKRAVGLHRLQLEGFEACHIWPLTCYDTRFHTAPANLVLLPRAVAGLSDHDREIQSALQYRALELYDWWPDGFERPIRPAFYPADWRDPMPDILGRRRTSRAGTTSGGDAPLGDDEIEMLAGRLVRWSTKPQLLVHKALAVIVTADEGMSRKQWVDRVAELTHSPNAYGATSQLFTKASNGYGRVLRERHGCVGFNPELEELAKSLPWRVS